MKPPVILLACLLAPFAAAAQSATPGALDLSVPQAPLRYMNDPSYQSDAPGTYYGDHSGPRPKRDAVAATTHDDGLQVHGAISTGIGYSKAFGNSHWTSADINLGKDYTTDEGNTRRVDLNIHISQGKGAGPFGYGPGPWHGW
ncbi:hypothetical protein [Stenotrophomonas sp. NLF4-10]|uniref:hypothetical protein n=1 Tax=Stenotrophomonas sp. NLF4-10 TaxID=2918754 RepID=UPI001EFAED33|nr:hypothetical protein [Stenotrophomonas sp. NLF4-10]MCG8277930.1 hypothetical protein [Stenotrophomonas sp. NLF4-10]